MDGSALASCGLGISGASGIVAVVSDRTDCGLMDVMMVLTRASIIATTAGKNLANFNGLEFARRNRVTKRACVVQCALAGLAWRAMSNAVRAQGLAAAGLGGDRLTPLCEVF